MGNSQISVMPLKVIFSVGTIEVLIISPIILSKTEGFSISVTTISHLPDFANRRSKI